LLLQVACAPTFGKQKGKTKGENKLRTCGGGQDNTPSEGGGGVRFLKSFSARVPFGSTESFSYLCSANLKAVTLWQHSITQQEN
jgi:hypothetical protein